MQGRVKVTFALRGAGGFGKIHAMKKDLLRLVAAFAVLVAIPAAAREISANEAGRAAAAWVRRDNAPLGAGIRSSDVAEVRTQKEGYMPLFHVVRMTGEGEEVTSI